jgi:hypothetical protein
MASILAAPTNSCQIKTNLTAVSRWYLGSCHRLPARHARLVAPSIHLKLNNPHLIALMSRQLPGVVGVAYKAQAGAKSTEVSAQKQAPAGHSIKDRFPAPGLSVDCWDWPGAFPVKQYARYSVDDSTSATTKTAAVFSTRSGPYSGLSHLTWSRTYHIWTTSFPVLG